MLQLVYLHKKSAINSHHSRRRSNSKRKKKVCMFNSKKDAHSWKKTKSPGSKQHDVWKFCWVGKYYCEQHNNHFSIWSPRNWHHKRYWKLYCFFFTWRLLVLLGDSEIIQVSVVDCDGLRRFDQYLYPNGSISFGTTRVIGRVALAGHNVRAIDVRRFWNNVKKWHLEYLSCVLALKVLLTHFH